MSDLDQLADDFVHDLLSDAAKREVESRLTNDALLQQAVQAARQRMRLIVDARPAIDTSELVRRVTSQMPVQPAKSQSGNRIRRWVGGAVAVSVLLLVGMHIRYATLSANEIDMFVAGQTELIAGTEASIRVRITDRGQPLTDTSVEVRLVAATGEAITVTTFTTDSNGTGSPRFLVPEWADGQYRLVVVALPKGTEERVESSVRLRRTARILVSTDKPIYRPGDTIRTRLLALKPLDPRPLANQQVTLSIIDPRGNIVFKRQGPTSKYGLFSADCELATELIEGPYGVSAKVDGTESHATVQVRPYVLPKFQINIALDQPFFRPNEPIQGRVLANYFYGRPVNGTARITLDGESRTVDVVNGAGTFQVPCHARNDLRWVESLHVEVTDTAAQQHSRTVPVRIAHHELKIEAAPATGVLYPGVPTTLRFRVVDLDDNPIQARFTSPGFFGAPATNAEGWASIPFTSLVTGFNASVKATTNDGRTVEHQVVVPAKSPGDALLSTNKSTYIAGETMTVSGFGINGAILVDVLRGGQTVRTEVMHASGSRGELAIDLPLDWVGEIELRAYGMGSNKQMGHRVKVRSADQIKIVGGVKPPKNADGHRPGEATRLDLQLRDAHGGPLVGAISLSAVDEAVFNVDTARPGEKKPMPIGASPTLDSESTASPLTLWRSTLPQKVNEARIASERGHRRAGIGWAVLAMGGIAYGLRYLAIHFPKTLIFGGIVAGAMAFLATSSMFVVTSRFDGAKFDATEAAAQAMVFGGENERAITRVRTEFPETLLWRPELITDETGRVSVDFTMADSITSWRFNASAISADGRLGNWRHDARVFQPFFVDVNLPGQLTRGDTIQLPVIVSSYLKEKQSVRVRLVAADWYNLEGPAERTVDLSTGEVKAVEFRVTVLKVGKQPLEIHAQAGPESDAIRRTITVVPDGAPVEVVTNGTLQQPATVPLKIPGNATEGSGRATLKLYPSGVSQLGESLNGIFQVPNGCFEQTSSTTYPNVLALRYLKDSRHVSAELEATARRYVHLGYQRLLTFEVSGGGFDWYGRGPANVTLSAYGLMEFRDMAAIHDVDPVLLERTRRWLERQRRPNGSWSEAGRFSADEYTTTAYIAWATSVGGNQPHVPTMEFLKQRKPEQLSDPYVLALVCNALLAMGDDATPFLERLASLAEGQTTSWSTRSRTIFFGSGPSANVETTALAVLAFTAAKTKPDLVRGALEWLAKQRGPAGTWGTTQATILALKAFVTTFVPNNVERRFEISIDGKPIRTWSVPPDQCDVLQQIDLTSQLQVGSRSLEVRELTSTATPFQVVVRHHVPTSPKTANEPPLGLSLQADRTTVAVGETITFTAGVWSRGKNSSPMVLLELPIPPGFEVDSLPNDREIDRTETRDGKIVVYLREVTTNAVREIPYRLRATHAGRVNCPPGRANEYYAPERSTSTSPMLLEVRDR